MFQRMRHQATFANVMATIALFVAAGGTSYAAITLPRNSVGRQQIKPRAVDSTELRRGAVTSRALKNGSVQPQDLSTASKAALTGERGPVGPPGVTLRAAQDSGGGTLAGNATFVTSDGANKWLIGFSRSLSGCVPTATLARNSGGQTSDPGPGRIVVGMERREQQDLVAVETYDATGQPAQLPFNVIVAC